VGKYLRAAQQSLQGQGEDEIVGYVDDEEEVAPARKKAKSSGFGNFDAW
jgi:peptidyl-prolyl cis-trans isomerase-like protein 2